jgi:hypothetical protein
MLSGVVGQHERQFTGLWSGWLAGALQSGARPGRLTAGDQDGVTLHVNPVVPVAEEPHASGTYSLRDDLRSRPVIVVAEDAIRP